MSTPESAIDTGLLALSDRGTERIKKILMSYMVAQTATRSLKRAYDMARARVTYTVSVPGDDEMYPALHDWLLAQMTAKQRKAVLARSGRSNDNSAPALDSDSPESHREHRLSLFYDGNSTQSVTIEGHKVAVHVDRPDRSGTLVLNGESAQRWMQSYERIVFTCYSPPARAAVEHMLNELARAQSEREPRLYIANGWGWNRQMDLPKRPLESVVLRGGQMDRLIDDLGKFLSQEADYARLGMPYHRGYLFYGAPGTGKTSVAKALADHFGMDAYYLPLTVVKDDASLVQMLHSVDPRSMLLLEDIDIVHASHTRDDDGDGISLSGLLNALDGFVTPHGLVTVMTTNNEEVLDPALTRPGRVDRKEHFDLLDEEQLRRLLRVLIGEDGNLHLATKVSPAEVIEVIKRHLSDSPSALAAVNELIQSLP